MAFDYKKEYKEFYMPKAQPAIVTVPPMRYLAVEGKGDPNQPDGAYQQAIGLLYAVAFTLKMSPKSGYRMEGFFDYVVPPLEGFWRQQKKADFDLSRKQDFEWTSVIRLPDFVTRADFDWALDQAARKKKLDVSAVQFRSISEGLCVQMMHLGPFDAEARTIAQMDAFAKENGYENDFTPERQHHEIYLSDARRVAPEKWKTVIRHPIKPSNLLI